MPLDTESMIDSMTLGKPVTLVNEAGFGVTKVRPLDERETYARTVFVCAKTYHREAKRARRYALHP